MKAHHGNPSTIFDFRRPDTFGSIPHNRLGGGGIFGAVAKGLNVVRAVCETAAQAAWLEANSAQLTDEQRASNRAAFVIGAANEVAQEVGLSYRFGITPVAGSPGPTSVPASVPAPPPPAENPPPLRPKRPTPPEPLHNQAEDEDVPSRRAVPRRRPAPVIEFNVGEDLPTPVTAPTVGSVPQHHTFTAATPAFPTAPRMRLSLDDLTRPVDGE